MYIQVTASERLLKKTLAEEGLYPVAQYRIGRFYVDFCFPELKLAIEVDGNIHNKEAVKARDKEKNYYLRLRGYTVLRYTNAAVNYSPRGVCLSIKSTIDNLSC